MIFSMTFEEILKSDTGRQFFASERAFSCGPGLVAIFQPEGWIPQRKQSENSLEKGGASTSSHFLRTREGTLFGPVACEGSSWRSRRWTVDGRKRTELRADVHGGGKMGIYCLIKVPLAYRSSTGSLTRAQWGGGGGLAVCGYWSVPCRHKV